MTEIVDDPEPLPPTRSPVKKAKFFLEEIAKLQPEPNDFPLKEAQRLAALALTALEAAWKRKKP